MMPLVDITKVGTNCTKLQQWVQVSAYGRFYGTHRPFFW